MAVLDPVRRLVRPDENKLDDDLIQKIGRGRENLQKIAPHRDEAWEFVRGNHFAYVGDNGKLSFLSSGSVGIRRRGKAPYQSRQARNFIFDVVRREASNAAQQVPSYQVIPSTADPEDVSAASLSEKILLYGHSRWNLRRATVDAVMHAVVGGEAFAWAYFDTTIGPFIGEGEDAIGIGDVRVRVYGSNECYWTPGLRFYEAPWHCVEQAADPAYVKALPGYLGEDLTTDADTRALSARSRNNDKGKLVLVTHYLERPCSKYPNGRWITMANNRRILEDRDYPGSGEDPVLRQLVYMPDPDNDRDLGLVAQLIDPQKTVDDSENKAIEWKNLMLQPQWAVTPGLMKKQRRTAEPNKVYEIPNPDQNLKVLETASIPDGLFTMGDRAQEHLLRIAGQQDIPQGVEAAKAISALLERNRAASAMFVTHLAEWHENVAHDCLVQVQENYSEPRLIAFRGTFGWESISDFKGALLRDQNDVRVLTDSIEPQTSQARAQKIMNYANMGAISPKEAMTAIETGATEGLVRTYAQAEARVGRIIQRLKQGPEALGAMPTIPTGRLVQVPQQVVDPNTGEPAFDAWGQPVTQMVDGDEPEMAPAWMPRRSDELGIFKTTFEDWMSGEEYERLTPEIQQAASQVYAGVLKLESEKAAEAAAVQSAQAEQLGMDAATRPPQPKPNPSLPGLEPTS